MVRESVNLLFAITSCMILCRIRVTGARFAHVVADESSTCPLANIIEQENHRTIGLSLQSLPDGKWVSQTCETRRGSRHKHLLRSYTFYSNHSFNVFQVFYEDEFCSSAAYSISAFGYLHANRHSYPELSYHFIRGTIVLHDVIAAERLLRHANNFCSNVSVRFWKPYTEYEIYNKDKIEDYEPQAKNGLAKNWLTESRSGENYDTDISYMKADSECWLSWLSTFFKELEYLKIYKRPFGGDWRTELFSSREHSRPNSFHFPLVLYNKSHYCPICARVADSSPIFVPVLHKEPKLFPATFVQGEWISERCEPVPQKRLDPEESLFELFATKNLRLDSETKQWELQIRYYSESACAILLAEHESYGTMDRYHESKIIPNAINVDFVTKKSFLLLWHSSLLKRIREDPSCGNTNYWQVGVKMELFITCSSIRFSFLNRFNIMKAKTDEHGEDILYLGEDEEESGRPTTFGYPLVRCNMQAIWKFWPPSDSSTLTAANWFLIFFGLFVSSKMG